MDHPGIVYQISNVLSGLGVNIESMETKTYAAPISGTPIFQLEADLAVPTRTNITRTARTFQRDSAARKYRYRFDRGEKLNKKPVPIVPNVPVVPIGSEKVTGLIRRVGTIGTPWNLWNYPAWLPLQAISAFAPATDY